MSKVALVHLLDRWTGAHECDLDSCFLTRFLSHRDEDAFAALVHRHGPLVYGTCLRILGNRNDSDDAFQAVFFVLARRAHTLKLDRSIGPWLYGVAVRVARKLRAQMVQRRLREMSAAKPERVEAAEPQDDFWAILDEELGRMASPLREVLLLCDLSGQSHAQTAASLGLAKGTITKRLAKAREQLATRLKRRGITLGVAALSTMISTQAQASVPAALVLDTAKQAVAYSIGQAGGTATAKTLAEGVMRSLKFGVVKVWLAVGLLGLTLAARLILAGGPQSTTEKKGDLFHGKADARPEAARAGTMWKEDFKVDFTGSVPVSVAFSADGKTLLTGDTNGEVTAWVFVGDEPRWRWKSKADGAHAMVAYSADQKKVYATTGHCVRILEAKTGQDVDRVEALSSNPIALGVFPTRGSRAQIVFGSAHGYFIKSWVEDGKPADTMGTIETSCLPKDAKPADTAAAPLAVDPKGRSAIMTGPRDATGEVSGAKGKNVLWAYVCGDYSEGSPGNRVMVGHTATVVSAAWSKEGATAVTGDADGRVIVWDARSMKETRRVELGGRVLALALSDDGSHTAAYIRMKGSADIYVWQTGKPAHALQPIHSEQADFGFEPYASLAFSPDGKRLAGCALDKRWLRLYPNPLLNGHVRVWQLAAEPKAQVPPKPLYTEKLPKGSSSNFVILNNLTILTQATKQGAIDFRDIRDGGIQARLVLGKFNLGKMKLSSDRKWLAIEQHPILEMGSDLPDESVDVAVYDAMVHKPTTIPGCKQLLDVASGGKVVAVVRDKQIELWDAPTAKKIKAAPFPYLRIDAAQFSPDGKLLAISDRNELVLWRWEENTHERIDLGRCVGSLAFTPDGKFLAEGPTPRDTIQVRDLTSRKVVRTLPCSTKRSMNVPALVFTQAGRVLIACDNVTLVKELAVPHRINIWDTSTGVLTHPIALPAGSPNNLDVSPNSRYLAAMVDDGDDGMNLSVWRLDGETPVNDPDRPPAATRPQ
jgi:RNA polymerase sigma factor (sigma-70 family)